MLSIGINAAVIGSYVAFSALTAAATVGTNLSYLIPIIARQTVGRNTFQPAKWNLGRYSIPVSVIASGYISFLFVVLMLPQVYPVTSVSCSKLCCLFPAIDLIPEYAQLLPCDYLRHHSDRTGRLAVSLRPGCSILVHWTKTHDLTRRSTTSTSEGQ